MEQAKQISNSYKLGGYFMANKIFNITLYSNVKFGYVSIT